MDISLRTLALALGETSLAGNPAAGLEQGVQQSSLRVKLGENLSQKNTMEMV